MKTINTENFEVGIHDDRKHGWFEHNEYGDEYGGMLWFNDDGILYDYDGIGGYLPREILDALEAEGFNVDDMRPEED